MDLRSIIDDNRHDQQIDEHEKIQNAAKTLAEEFAHSNGICTKTEDERECILQGLATPLASEESTRISLQSIREERDGLNKHRQSLLSRVPEQEKWSVFSHESIEDKDLAYLSAATGDEFALLRGKNEDILYHGSRAHCHIEKDELLMELLNTHKIRLECHSHPDYEIIIPSQDDRDFIASFGQQSSRIVSSYTGKIITFHANRFDDLV